METQRQPQSTEDEQWSASAPAPSAVSPQQDAVRVLEREMSISEFEEDRDAILMMMKDALRSRNYDDAQEIVHKYRAAIKKDDEFATLARMTAQGIEGNKKIAGIQTVLDATPDDDYDTRIALYERILKIHPGHEEAQNKLLECKRLRGDILPQPRQQLANVPHDTAPLSTSLLNIGKMIAICFGLFCMLVLLIALLI